MRKLVVMQVVDSLQLGGMEGVAVNLANSLHHHGTESYLCSTRMSGPLEGKIATGVGVLHLNRQGPVGLSALLRLVRFIEHKKVDLLHVHGTALFFSVLARLLRPHVQVLWHDHFGRYATEERSVPLYRLATQFVTGVIAVNQPLVDWSRLRLGVPEKRVWYLPNYVPDISDVPPLVGLPGTAGRRIACVANLRPEKDHLNLIEAMQLVVKADPAVRLFLVGSDSNKTESEKIRNRIVQLGLSDHVLVMGSRGDIPSILAACDIGVLSSASEGLPLALLEYGRAGIGTVATRVGQVPEVLEEGRAGLMVPPRNSAELAQALLRLLSSEPLRTELGKNLRCRVQDRYSEKAFLAGLSEIYNEACPAQ